MSRHSSPPLLSKIAKIWSSRQARQIPVRILYRTRQINGCQLYEIKTVQELDKKAA